MMEKENGSYYLGFRDLAVSFKCESLSLGTL